MTTEQPPQGWTPQPTPALPQAPAQRLVPLPNGTIVLALGMVVPQDTLGRIVESASFGREVLYMVDWFSTQPPEYPIVRRVMRRTEFRIVEEG